MTCLGLCIKAEISHDMSCNIVSLRQQRVVQALSGVRMQKYMRMHPQTEHSEVKNRPDRTSAGLAARGNVQHLIRIHRHTSGWTIKTMTLSREGKKAQEGPRPSANHGPQSTRPSTSSSFFPSSLFLLLSLFPDCISSILICLYFSADRHSLNC